MNIRTRNYCIVTTVLLAATACHSGPGASSAPMPDPAAALAKETEDLGRNHFPITTGSPIAQAWFDRGLVWCYGFHHAEAIRSFEQAAAADPNCAMAYWGMALAAGPNINNMEMTPATAERAHENAQRARALAAGVAPVEAALITALTARYASPAPADRAALDRAYADAMRKVYAAHGDHPDVAALFAEALMDLRPWDLWQADGTPQPETPEVLATLERLLAAHPDHPQGCHLYIHAVEASRQPERALPAARRLGSLVPGAGHLVHMPSHIYVRVGDYVNMAEANRRGIAADAKIVARTGRGGFYEVYRAHNYHFLVYAAMFEGRADEAIATAREMVRELPMATVREHADMLEAFLAVPYHALVRFGRWDDILREPEPAEWQSVTRAMRHYARGIAFAVTGDHAAAARERAQFAEAVQAVPEKRHVGNNPARVVLGVGEALLDGEIAFRAGQREDGFAALREAVRREEALRYDEPWGWMMPPRHALGALLLEAGEVDAAEEVYRADLLRHPDNGWALHGLSECLRRRGAQEEAAAVAARFTRAWGRAQTPIAASCFCRRG